MRTAVVLAFLSAPMLLGDVPPSGPRCDCGDDDDANDENSAEVIDGAKPASAGALPAESVSNH